MTEKTPVSRKKRVLLAAGGVLLLLVVSVGGLLFERERHFDGNIERLPEVFPAEDRATASAAGETWLMLGSDTRAASATTGDDAQQASWKYGAQRTDTIMMVHIPRDRKKIFLVSFPRDSYVDVPGHGPSKINAAYSWGGPPLLIKTLEKLTKVRIDHFSILDFAGFATMTDALGGVDVQIGKTVTGTEAGTDQDITWKAGRNHLDGGTALAFVRQRHGLPDGDLDRIKRQQAFLKALMSKAIQGGTLRNPLKLNAFLDAVTRSVSVDSSISGSKLRSLAFGLRGLGPSDVTFMTVPVAGTATVKGQSIVRLRTAEAQELYGALREDQVDDFLTKPGRANSVDRVR